MFSTIEILIGIAVLSVLAECIYSLYKKDGVYSVRGTVGNMLHGVFLNIISTKTSVAYFGFFFVLYSFLGYSHRGFDLFSFFTCLFFVDFFYYVFHRLHHSLSLLWVLHSVHHSDNKFNMSTYSRASLVQHIYMNVPMIPAVLVGFNPIIILYVSYVLFLYQLYCHSQYVRLPNILEKVLITPHTHSIHHDQEMLHQNSNFGAMFSIWDRFLGTYTPEIDTFKPGIKGYHQDNFIKMETDPIAQHIQHFFSPPRF